MGLPYPVCVCILLGQQCIDFLTKETLFLQQFKVVGHD